MKENSRAVLAAVDSRDIRNQALEEFGRVYEMSVLLNDRTFRQVGFEDRRFRSMCDNEPLEVKVELARAVAAESIEVIAPYCFNVPKRIELLRAIVDNTTRDTVQVAAQRLAKLLRILARGLLRLHASGRSPPGFLRLLRSAKVVRAWLTEHKDALGPRVREIEPPRNGNTSERRRRSDSDREIGG